MAWLLGPSDSLPLTRVLGTMGKLGQFHAGSAGLLILGLPRVDALIAVRVALGAHRVVDDDGVARDRQVHGQVIVRDSPLGLRGAAERSHQPLTLTTTPHSPATQGKE